MKTLLTSKLPVVLALCFLFACNAPVAEKQTKTYKVQKGETAFSIAQKHGISVEQLKELNPNIEQEMKSWQENMEINLPLEADIVALTHTVQKGESIFVIAQKYNLSVAQLKELNPSLLAEGNTWKEGLELKVVAK